MIFRKNLRNDKEVVLEAIKQNPAAFYYASNELKNDKEVALEAIKQDELAFYFVSDALKNDKDFVLEVVKRNPAAFYFASDELKNDKEVVLEAIKRDGEALQYASNNLRNNKDFVLEVVKRNGWAFEYVPDKFRNDNTLNYISNIAKDPKTFSSLPLNYFQTNEQLAPFIESIKIHLKNRVGQDVSQEDQKYATEVIKMVKDTIARKRNEIDQIEQEENKKAQRVNKYRNEIDEELES